MSDENGVIVGTIGPDTPTIPEDDIHHAPNAVGPNIELGIAPVGLIRVAFSVGVLMSAFYCDAEAARIIGSQFTEMADKLDEAHEEMRALIEKAEATTDTVEEDDTIQVQDVTVLSGVDEATEPVLN